MPGKHRKPSPLKITLRTTGGLVAGAAVIGTATVTAQAAVGAAPAGANPPSAAAAAEMAAPRAHDVPKKLSGGAGKATTTPPSPAAAKAPVKAAPKKKPTAQDAIKLAKSQVGIAEDGSGGTKFNEWYMSTDRAKETLERDGGDLEGYGDAQWCDMFVSWIGEKLGFTDGMGSDAWTVEHAKWFEKQDRWGDDPRPGAIVFFNWGGSKSIDDIVHVGMVIKDNGDGTVQTVEGNTSDAVKIRDRSADQIVGYGYPDYAK